jgi:hypothetical protein
MQVKILYILNFGMCGVHDTESLAVSKGLYLKHVNRCDAVGVFNVDVDSNSKAKLLPDQLKGSLPLKNAPGYDANAPGYDAGKAKEAAEVLLKAPKDASKDASGKMNRSIGVYVVMHYGGAGGLSTQPEEVAQTIDDLLPEEAKEKLHYIAMLACAIADKKDVEFAPEGDLTYMMRFMKELQNREMRPEVAGWDGFISAAPHRPEGQDVYADGNVVNLVNFPGKKIVRPRKKFVVVTDDYRSKHKHFYQVIEDGKLKMKLGGWST